MRGARCAPLPVLVVAATASLLPAGVMPPLLAEGPARTAVEQSSRTALAMPPLADRLHEVTTTGRATRSTQRAPLPPSATSRAHAHRAASSHRWVRPSGGPLTSPFGYRWGRLHKGIDLGASYGSPIYASTDGVIIYAGPKAGYGQLIVIRDWDGT